MSDDDRERKDVTEYKGLIAVLRDIDAQMKELKGRAEVLKKTLAEFLGKAEVGEVDGKPAFYNRVSYPKRFNQKAFKAKHPDLHAEFVEEAEQRTFTLAEPDDG